MYCALLPCATPENVPPDLPTDNERSIRWGWAEPTQPFSLAVQAVCQEKQISVQTPFGKHQCPARQRVAADNGLPLLSNVADLPPARQEIVHLPWLLLVQPN